MMIHDLKPAAGSNQEKKRKGRGPASGNGKTAGYGHKGQLARSGHKGAYFEGGQLPLVRRIPKRGFTNIFRVEYDVVNVSELNRFEDGATVTHFDLREAGLVGKKNAVKILGNGDLTKKLNVEAAKFTASAKEKIEKAGGTAKEV
ncbi:MAG: 50S ribosomal protein L15 [Oscillospiraceae bacterium]|nr:50S ribosomal protein L15 [Oscillospiraceae bacterium]